MKTTIKLAVASALVAAASSANAGIIIPAGDWTLDIGGVVNAYYTNTKADNIEHSVGYGGALYTSNNGLTGSASDNSQANISTGLLPNYLSVSGKTRQNDLDVAFTISINPGASTTSAGIQNGDNKGRTVNQENRQAFLTVGDKSWGSVKLGKDLGIFASDAILNDMTLLGVGSGAGGLAGNTTTTGRIGTGYMYADWKSQIAYSSPNWNGFSFTAGITQAFDAIAVAGGSGATALNSSASASRGGAQTAYEGKASYEWTGDVAGKVWMSAISQNVDNLGGSQTARGTKGDETAHAIDIGTNVNVAGFGLTAYYYDGSGIGQTVQLNHGFDTNGKARDSKGYYVQGTYTLPGVGTKLGASWGESRLDGTRADANLSELTDSMWTIGAYHPLTKHLNLVAEYSQVKSELDRKTTSTLENEAKTISLGAILFF